MKQIQQLPRMPNLLRKKGGLPTGPKFIPKQETVISGYGQSPPGFVIGGKNSEAEWPPYWALAKIYQNPIDPRTPPFRGGFPDWGYQVPMLGAHTRAVGSAVLDFVVYNPELIGIRLQGERWHIYTDARKHAGDAEQRFLLERGARIVDVYEEDYLGDPSGQKVIIAMKKALNLLTSIDPILSGTGIRGSRMKVLG